MRAKHIREWLQEHRAGEAEKVKAKEADAEKEGEKLGFYSEERESKDKEGTAGGVEEREPNKWEKVVDLVRLAFRDGVLPEEAAWQAVVLIPKEGGDYRGIGLVEVIWKAVVVILNFRFTAAITYHEFLHGFRADHGTGITTLDIKLIHQVVALREEVLHAIFLDLHKACYALERSRCLGILEGYGVGTRALRLLRLYWARLRMVARAGGYYGAPFRGEKGVTQGNPLSPTIFNVVVDAMVRHWE